MRRRPGYLSVSHTIISLSRQLVLEEIRVDLLEITEANLTTKNVEDFFNVCRQGRLRGKHQPSARLTMWHRAFQSATLRDAVLLVVDPTEQDKASGSPFCSEVLDSRAGDATFTPCEVRAGQESQFFTFFQRVVVLLA